MLQLVPGALRCSDPYIVQVQDKFGIKTWQWLVILPELLKISDVLRLLDLLTPDQQGALLVVLDDMCFHTEIRNKAIRDGAGKT